jgi:D-glycero-alpha-D-manno-heptose 1-phosphate guanylyltransferase
MRSHKIVNEAIILAGGLGTRLRTAVPDLPKCMAPVDGKPFLSYVIDYFLAQGIEKFIFALGYKSESIEDYLRANMPGQLPDGRQISYRLSIEREPLGTGGAIRLACTLSAADTVLVLNGDTFFRIRPDGLAAFHQQQDAECTLCLKPMKNFDRYGVVELGAGGRIRQFQEKRFYASGMINGGVYALDRASFLQKDLPSIFSFEKDYLESGIPGLRLFGLVQDEYFIDIGIPEDYQRAQLEIKKYAI